MSPIGQWIGKDIIRAMISHGIDSVAVEGRIFVVDVSIGEGDDIVLIIGRIEHRIVVDVVIVALDHQTTCCIPNHVVVHGAVLPCTHLANRSIESNAILDDVMNPVVSHFSVWGFALHDLNHSAIGLQMADVPHFVVEDLGRITNGEHR